MKLIGNSKVEIEWNEDRFVGFNFTINEEYKKNVKSEIQKPEIKYYNF